MPYSAIREYSNFIGLNNTSAPDNLNPNELRAANNIDITNDGYLKPRRTLAKILDGNFSNLYPFNNGLICTKNSDLIFLDKNLNQTIIKPSFSNLRISFKEINNKLYLSNTKEIGYIEHNSYIKFPESTDKKLRAPMPSGHLIDFFSGRLLCASHSSLFFSDPYDYTVMKVPDNFIQFKSQITNLCPLRTGIYLSASDTLFFLKGENIMEVTLEPVASIKLVPFSMKKISLDLFGTKTQIAEMLKYEPTQLEHGAFFLAEDGAYIGLEYGKLLRISEDRLSISDFNFGFSFVKKDDTLTQIICFI